MTASMEPLVQALPCADKQALRNFIRENSTHELPNDYLVCTTGPYLMILTDKGVLYFRIWGSPDRLEHSCAFD